MSAEARYAIYAAPPAGSALAAFGAAWLGYDAETGRAVPPPRIAGLTPERWDALTRRARHYGFHGTFKAPFQLGAGKSAEELTARLAEFAVARRALELPLTLARIGGFLALVPAAESLALNDLANACVATFDGFRQAETPEQVAKRRAGLSARQSAHLDRWGYPYVFEDYRYHMTLTDPLPGEESERLSSALTEMLAPLLAQPMRLDAVSLFAQSDRTTPFRLIRRFPLS
jgi:putative phosphonate metabolism protein